MTPAKIIIVAAWIAFGAYWAASAVRAKPGTARRDVPLRAAIIIVVVLLFRVFRPGNVAAPGTLLPVIGTALVLCGLAFAVWARVHLGRNWGMPMTVKEEPDLITSGPYAFVRHPIYTGILTAAIGTALAIDLLALVAAAIMAPYFVYSATIEERNLAASFPGTYAAYRARTKMLIPFVV